MGKANIIAGIGTGWPRAEPVSCNAISAGIVTAVNTLAIEKRDRIFLVGGNGLAIGNANLGLPEALRMKKLISTDNADRIFTDCDDASGFAPSHNTPENACNIVRYMLREAITSCDIVALKQHMPRVIGCIRKALFKAGLIDAVEITGYPIEAEFETNNAQFQLTSEENFLRWTVLANIHHFISGSIRRIEYVKMLIGYMPDGVRINSKFLSDQP